MSEALLPAAAFIGFLLVPLPAAAVPAEPPLAAPRFFNKSVVVSESAAASEVGRAVLVRGGNAVDAAVATALALAVTHPEAGNVGGGGFLLARLPDGRAFAFDFREKAPQAATAEMFLAKDGAYDPERHHWSPLSVGVPGTVAGLHAAHARLGKLPWKELVQPAVDLAGKGFKLSRGLARSLESALPAFRKYPASLAQFSKQGEPYREGDLLVQADLSRTLERIRDRGPEGFYR